MNHATPAENAFLFAFLAAWIVYVFWRLRPRDRQPFDRHTF